ncbi:MAG: hypothetical protein ACTS4V_01600 [Candidatus Hodgkinia cicadicola]
MHQAHQKGRERDREVETWVNAPPKEGKTNKLNLIKKRNVVNEREKSPLTPPLRREG